jgi:hypothetical protein
MNLERVIFNVNGAYIKQAQNAAEALPEGVLGKQTIIFERMASIVGDKEEKFILETQGSLCALELPEGLSNIHIYRNSKPGQGNGEVSFDCGGYHYIIPALKD